MSVGHSVVKFNPEEHRDNLFDAFCEFIDTFQYEYDAIAKDPPEGDDATQAAWIEQNKRKIFLGRFASRNLQKDYEDVVSEAERRTVTFTIMVNRLKERYRPMQNHTIANYEFHKLQQMQTESFDLFVNRVKHDAKNCQFSCENAACNIPDIMIRDQIIVGTCNDEIRRNALKNQWNLKDLVFHGRQIEAAEQGAVKITANKREPNNSELNEVARLSKPGRYSKKNRKYNNAEKSYVQQPTHKKCETCSSRTCPGKKKCPAYDYKCFDCQKKGHFRGSQKCKFTQKAQARRVESNSESSDENVTESETPSSGSDSEDPVKDLNRIKKFSKHVTKVRRVRQKVVRKISTKPRYQIEVVVNENVVPVFADTGADISVMSLKVAKQIKLPLNKTKVKIRPYGSKPLKCVGYYEGTIMYGSTVANSRIYVIKQPVETLLSGRLCEELQILKFHPQPSMDTQPPVRSVSADNYKESLIQQYPNVFKGIGKLEQYKAKIYIDDSVPPVAAPSRPIPFHLRDRFESEIRKMEEADIIEPHIGPAPWISNPVLAPKDDGGIRVTVDMRAANKAILSTNIPIPRAEDIRAQLSGCKYFTKLDFKSAFHQIEIDETSRYITVFHAGDQLKRFKRLTMGSKPASGELTKALLPIFQTYPEAHVIHDDVIIGTESLDHHHQVIDSILATIQRSGLTLNAEKCSFAKESIPFWGVIISKDGIKPDPSKVDALQHAGKPDNKDDVISFLCMMQSLSDFIPNLSQQTYHLRQLTKKHSQFKWNKHHQQEFENLKSALSNNTLLAYFNPDIPTYIYVDAHKSGLSATLLQGKTLDTAHPVAFSSRATSDVESRYPQLDLEALAIDFGLRRYRQYIAGGPKIDIITDHKPLVSIFSNTRKGSIRTDRIKLRHQDISYTVIWRKGTQNPSDYLSRHAIPFNKLPKSIRKETSEFEKTVWFLQFSPYTEAISMSNIIRATNSDNKLIKLKDCIIKGYIEKSNTQLSPYIKIFDELSISDAGLILRGDKIVLPEALREIAFQKAHQGGHPGMDSLKRRIRSHFWFPKMNEFIESAVRNCQLCQMFTIKTTKEPITPIEPPSTPWKEVSIDLFGPMPDKKHILVVQDIFTRFPAAKIVNSTSAEPIIKALNSVYTDFGSPQAHRSDNGPPFNSQAFYDFSQSHGINHKKVFPYHPQANPVETFMKPLGKTMKIAHYQNQDKTFALNDLLASYRATPHPATGHKPGDLIFQHGYSHQFPPVTPPQNIIPDAHQNDILQRLKRQERINSSIHRKTSNIKPGDTVIIKNQHRQRKFHPYFGPEQYKVISKAGQHGLNLEHITNNHAVTRHTDDVKLVYNPTTNAPIKFTPPVNYYYWTTHPQPAVETPHHNPTQTTTQNSHESSMPPPTPLEHSNHSPSFAVQGSELSAQPLSPSITTESTITQLQQSNVPDNIPTVSQNTNVCKEPPLPQLSIGDTVKQNKRATKPIERYTDINCPKKKGK